MASGTIHQIVGLFEIHSSLNEKHTWVFGSDGCAQAAGGLYQYPSTMAAENKSWSWVYLCHAAEVHVVFVSVDNAIETWLS